MAFSAVTILVFALGVSFGSLTTYTDLQSALLALLARPQLGRRGVLSSRTLLNVPGA